MRVTKYCPHISKCQVGVRRAYSEAALFGQQGLIVLKSKELAATHLPNQKKPYPLSNTKTEAETK
jgi:hypothetical protein